MITRLVQPKFEQNHRSGQMRSLNYFLLIVLLLGWGQWVYAQRCGGSIDYIPRDKKGELIDVGQIKVNYVRRVSAPEYIEPYMYHEDDDPSINRGHYQVNTLHVSTACGMTLVEVELEYAGRRMLLQFHNVPAEVNFYVDSLPFEKGTFEIEFKGGFWPEKLELVGVDLNRQGIKLADGTYVLGGQAKAGHLVAHTSWKKTTTKAKLTPKTARPYSRD